MPSCCFWMWTLLRMSSDRRREAGAELGLSSSAASAAGGWSSLMVSSSSTSLMSRTLAMSNSGERGDTSDRVAVSIGVCACAVPVGDTLARPEPTLSFSRDLAPDADLLRGLGLPAAAALVAEVEPEDLRRRRWWWRNVFLSSSSAILMGLPGEFSVMTGSDSVSDSILTDTFKMCQRSFAKIIKHDEF